ncbi:predicted protein, partial [Nematostella vectensis]
VIYIDGKWSSWSSWQTCSRTCGGGAQMRTRTCTNPAPIGGGRSCYGSSTDKQSCNPIPCRVDGQWSSWSGWDSCSMSCGGGTQSRTRACNSPAPRNGGRQCPGQSGQTRNC